ncbi:alpha/beta fold hydrolase [Glaciecola siphonariae]|uniref:Alpha/beta fold hydrolase n=1 Tax=Glaciecola siphonariae TaxID=521012 RepID=A0ABV9LTD0_9ALTE
MSVNEKSLVKGTISALECGAEYSQKVLFIHGYLDNAASFSKLLPLIKNAHCIAIDLPGHGHSSHRSEDAHYHLTDYVFDVHKLIVESGWDSVTLVGHSLGGIICSIYAATFPDYVSQVISIESLGPLTEHEFTSTEQLRASMLSRMAADKPVRHPESMAQIIAARMRVSDMTEQDCELILSRNTEYKEGQLRWRTDKRLRTKSALRFTPNQALDILQHIQCPYHILLADRGFPKIKRLYKHRLSALRKPKFYTFSGGHHVHLDSPEEVAACINRCIESLC